MALNKQHFQSGIDTISAELNSSNKSNKIIEDNKKKLLDLFLDDTAGLKTHEDVNEAFDHVKQLLESKKKEAENNNNEELSTDYKKLILSHTWSKNHYSEQYLEQTTSTGERTQQLKSLYNKIKELEETKKTKVPQNNSPDTIQPNKEDTRTEDAQKFEEFQKRIQKLEDQLQQLKGEKELQQLKEKLDDNSDNTESNSLDSKIKEKEKELQEVEEQSVNHGDMIDDRDNNKKIQDLLNNKFITIVDQATKKPYQLRYHNGKYHLIDQGNHTEISPKELNDRFGLDITPLEQFKKLGPKRFPTTIDKTRHLPAVINKQTDVIETTSGKLFETLTIDANLMDKQRLVYEAERNRIREESDRKYESANWFKKFGMFVGNRARQRRDIQESMKQARTNSTFIETDNTLQSRIEGNIGTYAEQHDMNIEGNNLKQRETIDGDGRIDAIAHEYIMGNISHTDAVRQFNFVFEHLYNTRKDISEIGSMTGTDIMAQLNNMNANEKKNYQIRHTIMEVFNNESIRVPSLSAEKITTIQALCKKRGISLSSLELTQQFELLKQEAIRQNIDNVSGTTHKMKVQLRAMVKKEKTEEIEGVRYDGMDSGIRGHLSKITNKLGRPGALVAKGAVGAGIALGGGAPLLAFGGALAIGGLFQYLKTRRDTLRETAKTHEDAINMGANELNTMLTELENNINNKTGIFQKVGSFMGWNALNRYKKQKSIIVSLIELRNSNALVSVDNLINNLKNGPQALKQGHMADVLSRIDAGHALDTQFIATTKEDGSGYGREMTTIKRNELMKELKASAINNPIYKTDASGRYIINPHTNTPEMISVSETSNPDEWREYRNTLKNNPEYTVRYNNLHTIYKNVQKNIKSNQNKQSLKSTGQYVANSVAIAATTMGLKVGFDAINGNLHTTTGPGLISNQVSGNEQAQFRLSGHDVGTTGNHTVVNYHALTNDTTIPTAQIEVGVDAVASKTGSFAGYLTNATSVQSHISGLGLDPTTTKTLTDALTAPQLNDIMAEGAKYSADVGNRQLLAYRRTEAIEHLANHLKSNHLTNLKIENIQFADINPTMEIQRSVAGATGNIAHRGFDILLEGTNTITGDIVQTSWSDVMKDSAQWARPSTLLPFFNTYGKSNNIKRHTSVPQGPGFTKTQHTNKGKKIISKKSSS